jgi:hypothetical protein
MSFKEGTTTYNFYFSEIFVKNAHCVNGEYTKWQKKIYLSISRLIREQNEKSLAPLFLIQDRFDKSKKPSHATVPLIIVNTDIHIH